MTESRVLKLRPPAVPPDTSFMYMIAGLCMLKLYQKRHPDINASAYTAYACMAGVIFFSVLGVVSAHTHTHTHIHSLQGGGNYWIT